MSSSATTAMATATFRLPSELKARVDNLAKTTRRSPSSIYLQVLEEHIGELEEVYKCLAIRDGIKAGTIKTYTTEEVEKALGFMMVYTSDLERVQKCSCHRLGE